jgi:hypothetical protein
MTLSVRFPENLVGVVLAQCLGGFVDTFNYAVKTGEDLVIDAAGPA